MFKKISSFENEICQSMEKSLVANQTEQLYGFDKIAKAADFLNDAASIFDQAGLYSEASDITDVLESLTKVLSGKND